MQLTARQTRRRTVLMRGMTLLELLLALAGTAVIGTAIASMLAGVAYGTQADKNLQSLLARQMALRSRIEAEVRESHLILDSGTNYVILWSGDLDESGTPDKSELQLIEYNAATDRVMRYAPAPLISDEAYALTDDFRTIVNNYKGDATFPAERWAEAIDSFIITLDHLDPQSARLISIRFGMSGGEVPDIGISAAAIRNEVSQ